MNSQSRPLSILITDDITENRVYISQIIKSVLKNAQFKEAENGKLAVNAVEERIKIKKVSFDLIIMDYKMPVMNGADATSAIRQLESAAQLPTNSIIITWSTAKNSPFRDADDWLPKMAQRDEVETLLQTHHLL